MLKRKPKTTTQKMREQADEVLEWLEPRMEQAKEAAAPVLADAKVKAAEAREKAAPYMAEAREKAAPYVAEAREKTAPTVDNARTKLTTEVLPVITAAVHAASEATEEAREQAKKRGAATAAALKGEIEAPEKKESHKFRNFLILLGLGGVVAFVAKKMSDREASTAWQSSYTPTPASGATTPSYSAPGVSEVDETPMGTAAAAAAAKTRDEGAAAPDEAAADAAEEPHPATTPDNPVEEVKVDGDKKS
jgi:hypothetical protein